MKKDISTIEDIQLMVNNFYTKIRTDEILGHIFNEIIKNNWEVHLEKMVRFWQTVLLEKHTYNGSPFLPHAKLPIDSKHFERWLHLFNLTIDEFFIGEKASKAKWQGKKMAEMFEVKINYYKNNPAIPLL